MQQRSLTSLASLKFSKEAEHVVEEWKLKIIYVSLPQLPSSVPEGEEEGDSPRGYVSDNGHLSGSESAAGPRALSCGLCSQRPPMFFFLGKWLFPEVTNSYCNLAIVSNHNFGNTGILL
ncbi:uncharacterized protein LOC141587368 [Silene latifolia]|uniref:uncharacterized protein LOC141587368 n=1 Tax=Silene latifolia TaxID=37657 RepID=UPI003D788119